MFLKQKQPPQKPPKTTYFAGFSLHQPSVESASSVISTPGDTMVYPNRFATATARLRRWTLAVGLCLVILFASALPAAAMSGSPSTRNKPTEGEVSLDKIQQRSREVLKEGPRGMEAVTSRAEGGINAVQGGADANKMNRPSNSSQATTAAEKAKKALEKITPSNP
jgi:hypothetical protein